MVGTDAQLDGQTVIKNPIGVQAETCRPLTVFLSLFGAGRIASSEGGICLIMA